MSENDIEQARKLRNNAGSDWVQYNLACGKYENAYIGILSKYIELEQAIAEAVKEIKGIKDEYEKLGQHREVGDYEIVLQILKDKTEDKA